MIKYSFTTSISASERQSASRERVIARLQLERSARVALWFCLPILGVLVLAGAAVFATAARRRSPASLARFSTDHYEFYSQGESYAPDRVRQLAESRERLLAQMAARLNSPLPGKIRLYLYATYEEKAADGFGHGEFHADPATSTVAAIWNDSVTPVELLPDALVLTDKAWGKPAHPFLGLAVAVYAAGFWRGQPIAHWGPQITFEEGPYSLEVLTAADPGTGRQGDFLSPLVQRPLAGEFARWLISRWGLLKLREVYSQAKAPLLPQLGALLHISPEQLESEWRKWLQEQARSYAPQPAPASREPSFQRGVAFTQERFRNGGDYAASRMAEVLASLKPLGVEWISVHPFASMPGKSLPQIFRYAGESDEGINNTTFQAHRLGMKVLLKPQIWLRGGLFAGDVQFADSRDRALWFRRYRQWILHYARLAEWNHSDMLSVGNELRQMAQHESRWRELIRTVRRIYHGPITYSAHWGAEFETLEFWDALDYIGLNNYYPLTRDGDASAAALRQGAGDLVRRVEQVYRRWRRPVIFTEVGFPSLRGGTVQPWKERTSTVVDTGEQARAYEAIFQAFYDRPWFYGMYWWKWYSTGSGGGPADGLLTPMNKPAADVMALWYRRPDRRPATTKTR